MWRDCSDDPTGMVAATKFIVSTSINNFYINRNIRIRICMSRNTLLEISVAFQIFSEICAIKSLGCYFISISKISNWLLLPSKYETNSFINLSNHSRILELP